MKPILFNFSMPIITPRLILKPSQIGDSGLGLMTEAVNAITQYAFKQLAVNLGA